MISHWEIDRSHGTSQEDKSQYLHQPSYHVVEPDTDELTESGRVVISDSLGITVGFEDGVGLDNLVLKGGLFLLTLLHLLGTRAGSNEGKVGDDLLGVLSLSSSRLTSNQDGLIFTFETHGVIGTLSNSKDVGRDFIPPLTTVDSDSSHGVDGEPLVGVDGDTEETRVGVDESLNVSLLQVEQDGGVIEIGQIRHVLAAVVLGRIDLGNKLLLKGFLLALPGTLGYLDLDLVAGGLLDDTLGKLLLDLVTHKEIWSWIRIRFPGIQDNFRSGHSDNRRILSFSTNNSLI